MTYLHTSCTNNMMNLVLLVSLDFCCVLQEITHSLEIHWNQSFCLIWKTFQMPFLNVIRIFEIYFSFLGTLSWCWHVLTCSFTSGSELLFYLWVLCCCRTLNKNIFMLLYYTSMWPKARFCWFCHETETENIKLKLKRIKWKLMKINYFPLCLI